MSVIELKGFSCAGIPTLPSRLQSFTKRKLENEQKIYGFLLVLWKYSRKNMDERLQIHYVKYTILKLGQFGNKQIMELSPG